MDTTAEIAHPTAGATGLASVRLPITVVVADGHEPTRRRLRRSLQAEHDIQVRSVASDLRATLRQVGRHAPEVLLLELGLPGGSTTELIRHLSRTAPGTRIVVVTMEDSPVVAEHVIGAGAVGYMLKHHADAELIDAIRAAAAGKTYVSPRLRPWVRVATAARSAASSDSSPRSTRRQVSDCR